MGGYGKGRRKLLLIREYKPLSLILIPIDFYHRGVGPRIEEAFRE